MTRRKWAWIKDREAVTRGDQKAWASTFQSVADWVDWPVERHLRTLELSPREDQGL